MGASYLNQAGTSWPKPPEVRAAVAEALAAPPETWAERLAADRECVAAAFGVRAPERLLPTPGCTSALAVALSDLPWEGGERVVTSGLEHHALSGAVERLAARGVERTSLPVASGRDGGEREARFLEALEAELRRGGVRLVALTAASNVTGELLPFAAAARLAREHGALSLLDAAQVAGWIPLDVEALGLDLLAFAGHKALHGPWGLGGLWVAPHVEMRSPAAVCELPAPGEAEAAAACAPMPGFCDVGSVDRAALAGVAAGVRWLAAPQRAERLPRARALVEEAARRIEALPGVTLHGPREPERRLPTLALTVAGRAPAALAEALAARDVVVSGGLQCAPLAHEALGTAPDGVLRLSAGPANDEADVARAVEALADVVGAGTG